MAMRCDGWKLRHLFPFQFNTKLKTCFEKNTFARWPKQKCTKDLPYNQIIQKNPANQKTATEVISHQLITIWPDIYRFCGKHSELMGFVECRLKELQMNSVRHVLVPWCNSYQWAKEPLLLLEWTLHLLNTSTITHWVRVRSVILRRSVVMSCVGIVPERKIEPKTNVHLTLIWRAYHGESKY